VGNTIQRMHAEAGEIEQSVIPSRFRKSDINDSAIVDLNI